MAKMTNEAVAKALGTWEGQWDSKFTCPAYTTSLDAIVAEIEARGFYYDFAKGKLAYYASVWPPRGYALKQNGQENTAPLALCAALLAFIKENKP